MSKWSKSSYGLVMLMLFTIMLLKIYLDFTFFCVFVINSVFILVAARKFIEKLNSRKLTTKKKIVGKITDREPFASVSK